MPEAQDSSSIGRDGGSPPLTIVTCIEPGHLEYQVPMMVDSLRRFGGRFARCPVIAVDPRRYAVPLRSSTKTRLAELGVEVIPARSKAHRYSWWTFLNKPLAVNAAAPHIKTDHACWIDGDVLVAKPPEAFGLNPKVGIQACVDEIGPISTGPDSQFEPFWAHLAEAADVPLDRLPWVTSPGTGRKVRIYFNAGIFRYRLGVDYERVWLKTVEDLLDAKFVARDDPSIFMFEQIAMGLAAVRLGLEIEELPPAYNYHIADSFERFFPVSRWPEAVLFHYHQALNDGHYEKTLARMKGQCPDVADLIESHRRPETSILWKLRSFPRRFFKSAAGKRESAHLAACKRV